MNEEYFYRFEFSSMHNTKKSMNYSVYAATADDLKIFLNQHGFTDVPNEAVTMVPKSEARYTSKIIEPYRFKSNKSNEIFTVYTCWEYIEDALQNATNDLTQCMLFGEAIIRRDIGIFKYIGDLIDHIKHAVIIDYIIADIETLNSMECEDKSSKEIKEMRDTYRMRIGAPSEDFASVSVMEELLDAIPDNDEGVMPITLECYTSSFTEMMMDAFE